MKINENNENIFNRVIFCFYKIKIERRENE